MPPDRSVSHRPLRRGLKLVLALALLAYPVLIYVLHGTVSATGLLAWLLVLLAGRMVAAMAVSRRWTWSSWLLAGVCMAAACALWLGGPFVSMQWLRWYPALMDLAVAAVFFGSLRTGRPLVERFARIMEPDLAPWAITYTRRVTWAWGIFMVLVAALAAFTAWGASLRWWSAFNGLLVYVLFGLAFAAEYALRCHVRRKWERHARTA